MIEPADTSLLEPPTSPDRILWDLWLSRYQFPALTVADELGLFPVLARTPMRSDELAAALKFVPRASEALLGLLTSLGFLVQHKIAST